MLKLVTCLLLPITALAMRSVRYVEYNPPVVYPTKDHVTVSARNRYRLTCEGSREVKWHLPHEDPEKPLRPDIADRISISYSTNPTHKHNYTSNLEIKDMVFTDTGSYRCSFNNTEDKTSIDANTYIHVYVYDQKHLLTRDDFDFQQFVQYETAIIPCSTTHPNVSVELSMQDKGVIKPDNKYIQFNPKVGFLISPVLPEHTGLYTCTARYEDKTSIYFSQIKVLPENNYVPPPHINKTSGEHTTVGQTLVLTCSITVDWSIQVRLTWSVPNQAKNLMRMDQPEPVSRNVTIGGKPLKVVEQVLRINHVEQEDQGTYECIVTDHSKNSRKVREFIRIYERDQSFLRVWVDGSKTVQRPGGRDETVQWVVNFSAHPPPKITWYDPEGNVIEEGEDKKLGRTTQTITGKDVRSVLRLRGLEIEDSGEYRAKVENQFSVKWENFSLIVTDPPQVTTQIVNPPISGLFSLGDEYMIKCIARGYPTPKVDWTFVRCTNYGKCDKVAENLGNSKEIYNSRYEVESVLSVVATKSGQYTCIANSNEHAEKSSVDFFVTGVNNGFEINGEERVLEGEKVEVRCTVSRYNYSEDSVAWYKLTVKGPKELTNSLDTGLELYNDRSSQFDIVKGLKFKSVKTSDSGKYVCRAKVPSSRGSGGGPRRRHNADYATKEEQFELRVEPYIAPVIYSSNMHGNETMVFGRGEGVRLYCRVRGTRMPQVEWYKDGVRVSMPHDNIKLLDSSQTLSVGVVVQGIDDGLYSCIAQNARGVVERSQRVVKVEAPSIYQTNLLGEPGNEDETSTLPKVLESGGKMLLQCRVSGRPEPVIFWTLDGEMLSPPRVNLTDNNQTLIVEDLRKDRDQGRYECVVNNVGGAASVYQDVKVEETSFLAVIFKKGVVIPVFIALGVVLVILITLCLLAKLCLRNNRCKNPPTPPTPRLTQFDLPEDENDAAESCRLTLSRDGSPFVGGGGGGGGMTANSAAAAMSVCHGCAGCSGTCHQCSACHYNFNGIYGCTSGYPGAPTGSLLYSTTAAGGGSILGVRGCTPVQAGYSPGMNEFAMYNSATLQHSQHTLPSSRYNTVKRVAIEPLKHDRRSASPRLSAEF